MRALFDEHIFEKLILVLSRQVDFFLEDVKVDLHLLFAGDLLLDGDLFEQSFVGLHVELEPIIVLYFLFFPIILLFFCLFLISVLKLKAHLVLARALTDQVEGLLPPIAMVGAQVLLGTCRLHSLLLLKALGVSSLSANRTVVGV